MQPIELVPVISKPTEVKPPLCQHENETYLKNGPSAEFINCAHQTLKLSRHTGLLFGVKAPEYIKRGRSIVYRKSTLEKWLAQFVERPNTSA